MDAPPSVSAAALRAANAALRQANAALRAEHEPLRQRVAALEAQVATLLARVAEREAALTAACGPGSGGHGAVSRAPAAPAGQQAPGGAPPGKPGQKPGQPGVTRAVPAAVDEVDEVVEVPLEACPHGGGPVEDVPVEEQGVEDLPPAPRPVVRTYVTRRGSGPRGQRHVASRHPEQVPGVQVGPRAVAVAAQLKRQVGVPSRKTAQVLSLLGGLVVSPGGLAQAIQRLGTGLTPTDEALTTAVRQRAAVPADETGWRLGGRRAWLWSFTTRRSAISRVDRHRRQDVVLALLGETFAGVLITDCSSAYHPLSYRQQQCLVPLLRELTAPAARTPSAAYQRCYGRLRRWCLLALAVQARTPTLAPPAVAAHATRLAARLDTLSGQTYADPDCQRLAGRLRTQRHQRLVFRCEPAVAGTNNRAERGIPPSVVVRKSSAGNRSERGAAAHGVRCSVLRPARCRGARSWTPCWSWSGPTMPYRHFGALDPAHDRASLTWG